MIRTPCVSSYPDSALLCKSSASLARSSAATLQAEGRRGWRRLQLRKGVRALPGAVAVSIGTRRLKRSWDMRKGQAVSKNQWLLASHGDQDGGVFNTSQLYPP